MSTIELQHHSSIFGDIAVHFPRNNLNLIVANFDKASVRPRIIALARYEKYFAHPHYSTYGRLRLSAYRTRELFFASRVFRPEPHYLDSS